MTAGGSGVKQKKPEISFCQQFGTETCRPLGNIWRFFGATHCVRFSQKNRIRRTAAQSPSDWPTAALAAQGGICGRSPRINLESVEKASAFSGIQHVASVSITDPVSPPQSWGRPPSTPRSLSAAPGCSSSPATTPVGDETRSPQRHPNGKRQLEVQTLKSSSTMKSQPIKSKRPRRRSNLDLAARKH